VFSDRGQFTYWQSSDAEALHSWCRYVLGHEWRRCLVFCPYLYKTGVLAENSSHPRIYFCLKKGRKSASFSKRRSASKRHLLTWRMGAFNSAEMSEYSIGIAVQIRIRSSRERPNCCASCARVVMFASNRRVNRSSHRVLSPEEAARFLKVAATKPHGLIFELALWTGMRPEEYLALQWSDIDLSKGTARIRRALVRHKKTVQFEEPKTARSRRTVYLPQPIVQKTQSS
jgi:integrase